MAAVIDDSVTVSITPLVPEEEEVAFGLTAFQLLLVGGAAVVAGLAIALSLR